MSKPVYQIADRGDLRKYRTEVPNMVDDADLSVYAFRLYVHLKRVAGDSGRCYQSTATMAKACKMSAGMVSKAKIELVNKNLILLTIKKGEHGEFDSHLIEIKDVWAENFSKYSTYSPHEQEPSLDEQVPSHDMNGTVSPHETKNEPIKNKHNGRAKAQPDPRSKDPAILAVKGIIGRYPPKELYDEIILTLGGSPDLDYLGKCRVKWLKRGYNPNAWEWLTDWYKNKSMPNGNGKQGQANEVTPAPASKDGDGGMSL